MSQTGAEYQQGPASGGLSRIQTSGLNKLIWKRFIHTRGRAQGEVWAVAEAAQEPPQTLGSPWKCQCRNPQPKGLPASSDPSGPAFPQGSGSPGRLSLEESVISHSFRSRGRPEPPSVPSLCRGQTQQEPVPVTARAELLLTPCCSSSHQHKRRFLSKNYARYCKNPQAGKIM